MLSVLGARPAARAAVIAAYVLLAGWTRVLFSSAPQAAAPVLVIGGVALAVTAIGWGPARLGLGTSHLALRVVGGCALAVALLLPAATRASAAPLLPLSLALPAVVVSIGEEVAFRGALYAALEDLGGARLAIVGSTALWTASHALSHPPEFLLVVAAAGLLLAIWRWACNDLVAPIIGHVIADLAL